MSRTNKEISEELARGTFSFFGKVPTDEQIDRLVSHITRSIMEWAVKEFDIEVSE